MAIDLKSYTEELFKAAGVSDDNVKQAVTSFLTNDAVSKRLSDDILRQQDYSRNMDALSQEKRNTADYYQKLVTWKAEQDQLYAGLQPQPVQPVQGDFLTKKDLEAMQAEYKKELDRREQVNISLLKDGMHLASQHAVEFREPLDTDALAKIAVDKNMSLRQAYAEMVGPRRKEQSDIAAKERDKRIAAEAVREFASQHQIPVDSTPRDSGFGKPTFDGSSKAVVDYDGAKQLGRLTNAQSNALRAGFVEDWNKAEAGTSGT